MFCRKNPAFLVYTVSLLAFDSSALSADNIKITATTVRVPVFNSHSESINIEFYNDFDLDDLKAKNLKDDSEEIYSIDDIDSLVFDPEIRAKIVQELQRKHELVFLSWKLGGGASSIGKQGRLSITLYNKDDEFQEVKENIETAKSSNTAKKTLIDFYRELPEGQEGTDLGLYYLSYLDDACKKVNVKFESLVNQYSASDLTVINLNFNF